MLDEYVNLGIEASNTHEQLSKFVKEDCDHGQNENGIAKW